MTEQKRSEAPVFTVSLRHGLADRRRLPLHHVLSVLDEVRLMLADAGRAVQNAQGRRDADGDFGLELLAGEGGAAFRAGSLETRIALTTDKANAALAADMVLDTVNGLADGRPPEPPVNGAQAQIIRRLNRIAGIQKTDKIDTVFSLQKPGEAKSRKAVFNECAISCAGVLTGEEFTEESVTAFGMLCKLEDRDFENEGGKDIFGELRHDTGERWRVQFQDSDRAAAAQAFGRQVALTGAVTHYRTASPRLLVDVGGIEIDADRDCEAAFSELFGCDKALYGDTDLESLLAEIRG